jgi:hypothetical protein
MDNASGELVEDTNNRRWDRNIAALGNQIRAKEDALAAANARIVELERRNADADKAAVYIAMAGNPRDWCLNCGTVSGNEECHCNDALAVESCMRNAVNYHDASLKEYRARIADLEAALALFIKYDTGPSTAAGAIKDYHAAMAAAKAAMKDKIK